MSGKTSLGILAVVVLTGCFSACGSEESPARRRGDSRYGQVGSPLTPSNPSVPYLDFDQNAPDGSVALTFDDGPDDVNTVKVLDTLAAKGVKATFFINADNYVDVASDSTAIALVKRMLSDGHDIGNHTAHHADLGSSSTDVAAELDGVDSLLHDIAPGAFQVRLWRAPYGNPWFGPQSRLDYVAPIGAHYGVHVGWNIDSLDADGCGSTRCVHDNVINAVASGKSGIVLMHSPNPYTAAVLGSIIDDLRSRGKRFVKVEALVQAKYGDLSRHLFTCDSNSDCIASETCVSSHCRARTSTDAGTDTSTDATSDTSTGDSSTGDGSTDDTGGAGSSGTVTCSAFTVSSGTVTNSSSACSGTTPVLATVNGTSAIWSGKAVAYATYHSPYDSAHVTGMDLTVAYTGDDETEPLWYWWVHNPAIALPNGWDLVGDNSWAGNWVKTTHTFSIPTPSKYVDASNNVLIRFGTNTSTNTAELDQMVMSFTGTTGAVDAGTADTSTPDGTGTDGTVSDSTVVDTSVSDTAVDDTSSTDTAVTDTSSGDTSSGDTAKVTDTVRCSTLTLVSGSLYGSSTSACSGTTPALATVNGTVVGWAGKTGSPKTAAYATYVSPAVAGSVAAMQLTVSFIGDNNTEPLWYWYAKNITTGAWELVGDNSWAGNWVRTNHTFTISNPARYVAADRTVHILFTTTSSSNDAELDQMVLAVTH